MHHDRLSATLCKRSVKAGITYRIMETGNLYALPRFRGNHKCAQCLIHPRLQDRTTHGEIQLNFIAQDDDGITVGTICTACTVALFSDRIRGCWAHGQGQSRRCVHGGDTQCNGNRERQHQTHDGQ